VLVDSRGREVGRPAKDANIPAIPGHKLKLTIDLDMQKAAEVAMEGKNGALVAIDPRNGEILAMVSRPTFDPNDFAIRISSKEWKELTEDPNHPLLNKAIQAQLAPGSVFKIIMAVAGTNEGIAQNLHVNCPGGGTFYGRYFKCWVVAEHRVHGEVDLTKAIYQSCDVFFYTLAERLGIEKIAKWATMLGIGKKTGIDLPNEASGVMPSEEWKMRTFRQRWYPGEVISVGIGQGAVATTPIQLARAIGGIAMGGTLYRPHVVRPEDLPPEFQRLANSDLPDVVHVPMNPQAWVTITDAMSDVVRPGVGTAGMEHLEGIDFAGKTGSAQVISNTLRKSRGFSSKQYKDNGWFVGVAPRRNPEVVVCALLEQGEHGYLAARVVSQVVKAYVEKQRRLQNNPTLFSDKDDPGSVPVAGFWNNAMNGHETEQQPAESASANSDQLHGGTMLVKVGRTNSASVLGHKPQIGVGGEH
jgi:penicillin-binding protein 2